jgi:hypothetical protein
VPPHVPIAQGPALSVLWENRYKVASYSQIVILALEIAPLSRIDPEIAIVDVAMSPMPALVTQLWRGRCEVP